MRFALGPPAVSPRKDFGTEGTELAMALSAMPTSTCPFRRAYLRSLLLFIMFEISEEAGTEVIGLEARLCSDFDRESETGICC